MTIKSPVDSNLEFISVVSLVSIVGSDVGAADALSDGDIDCEIEPATVDAAKGFIDGTTVGDAGVSKVGAAVGSGVGIGTAVGSEVGSAVGSSVGSKVSTLGIAEKKIKWSTHYQHSTFPNISLKC